MEAGNTKEQVKLISRLTDLTPASGERHARQDMAAIDR